MKKLIVTIFVWPMTELFWMIPNKYDVPFFVTVAMALLFLLEVEMNQQALDFSAPTGDELKRQILADLESKYPRWIDWARDKARKHCIIYGRVSSNDINEMIASGEIPAPPHFNAMGAVFRKGFRKIGIEEVKHASARNRGGGVTVWGLAS